MRTKHSRALPVSPGLVDTDRFAECANISHRGLCGLVCRIIRLNRQQGKQHGTAQEHLAREVPTRHIQGPCTPNEDTSRLWAPLETSKVVRNPKHPKLTKEPRTKEVFRLPSICCDFGHVLL